MRLSNLVDVLTLSLIWAIFICFTMCFIRCSLKKETRAKKGLSCNISLNMQQVGEVIYL